MATEYYGFSTLQANQLNWDQDFNVDLGDIDYLFRARMHQPSAWQDLAQAQASAMPPYVLQRVRQGLYGLPVFEGTTNLVPDAAKFEGWTENGSGISYRVFDRVMGTRAVDIGDASSYVEHSFSTGADTDYMVSYQGDATIEIRDGGTVVATITASGTSVTLTASHSYTLRISGNGKWAAHVQVEAKSYVTPFCSAEAPRYDVNLVWHLDEAQRINAAVLFATGPSLTGRDSGRIFWTDDFEIFFDAGKTSLTLKRGTETWQYLYTFEAGQVYLLGIVLTDSHIKVFLNQVPVITVEVAATINQYGFSNGVCNCFILGMRVDEWKGIDLLATPAMFQDALRPRHDGVVQVSSNYTIAWLDDVVLVDSSSGAVTVTLPRTIEAHGRRVTVKDAGGAAGTNTITVDTAGDSTIDGAATASISSNYGTLTMICDGTDWHII